MLYIGYRNWTLARASDEFVADIISKNVEREWC